MQALRVYNASLAQILRDTGWNEIKTQYGVGQAAWTFVYDASKPLCFDIHDAMEKGECYICDSFTMTF